MMARPLVAERFFDDNEKSLFRQFRGDPPGRSQTEQEAATRSKHLFCDEHRKGRTHGTANDADSFPGQIEGQHVGVVAGPAGKWLAAPIGSQRSNDITIGIENADFGHREIWQTALPSRLPQKILRQEHGGRGVVFVL